MKFPIKKRENKNISHYLHEDIQIARKFAKLMHQEFGTFISSMVLFGSAAKNIPNPKRDIDLLIIGKSSKRVKDTIKGYPFKINAHYSTLENFEKLLHRKNTLAREIAKNHIIFSGCEEFVKILMRYYQ